MKDLWSGSDSVSVHTAVSGTMTVLRCLYRNLAIYVFPIFPDPFTEENSTMRLCWHFLLFFVAPFSVSAP